MKTPMQKHLEWLKARMVVTEQMEKELLSDEQKQLSKSYIEGYDAGFATAMHDINRYYSLNKK